MSAGGLESSNNYQVFSRTLRRIRMRTNALDAFKFKF